MAIDVAIDDSSLILDTILLCEVYGDINCFVLAWM